jgi:hypothetical protein
MWHLFWMGFDVALGALLALMLVGLFLKIIDTLLD